MKITNSKIPHPSRPERVFIPHPSAAISNTAHFTAVVWAGLGIPNAQKFVTARGRVLREVVRWGGATLGLFGRYEAANLFLTTRHLAINALLKQRQPAQVIEMAAGLSVRGYNWTQQHAGIYIELDQEAVITTKQTILAQATAKDNHRLLIADLVRDDVAALIRPLLDRTVPTLIIVEGLTAYLDRAALLTLLQKIHALASNFENCTILIDLYLKPNRREHGRVAYAMSPAMLFWRLMRAPDRLFLRDAAEIRALLERAGFIINRLYSVTELAQIIKRTPPPVNLFYLAELGVREQVTQINTDTHR